MNCAIRSLGLVTRSFYLHNLFPRIAICSLDVHKSFSRIEIRDGKKLRPRVAAALTR